MYNRKIKIGTRASKLALTQAAIVADSLHVKCGIAKEQIEIVKITTTGDKITNRPLYNIGGKGLFTKEIEDSLLAGAIDIAVHSMKDIPAKQPDGLCIECVLEREDPRDALISEKYSNLNKLDKKAVVGTSSVRRQIQLRNLFPDIKIVPFRGNVTTRMKKLQEGGADATILAMAGLKRLGIANDKLVTPISANTCLPAVCQGVIGIQSLQHNTEMLDMLGTINDDKAAISTKAERAFLAELEGNCQTPMAALAEIKDDEIHLRCMLASLDGSKICYTERKGKNSDAIAIGVDAAKELMQKTGKK